MMDQRDIRRESGDIAETMDLRSEHTYEGDYDYYYDYDEVGSATKNDWIAFGSLIKKARLPWLMVAIAFVLSIISSRVSVLFPDYSIQFFEEGDITSRTIVTGIGLLILAAVVSITKTYIEARLRTGISMRLRDKVLDKILALRLTGVNRMNPRELISRTSSDTTMLSDFIVTIFMVVAGELFHFYFAMTSIYWYHRSLFLFQLIFIPVSILSHVIQGRFAYKFQYRIQMRLARLTEYLSELLVNIPVIKIFTREESEVANGEDRIDKYAKVRVKSAVLDVIFSVVDEVVRFGNRAFAIFYGGYLVYSGELDIGTWIAYYMIVEQVSMNLEILTAQWTVLKGIQGAVSRTAEIMEMDEEVYEGEEIADETAPLTMEDYALTLGDKEILKGIDTEVGRKEKIAIVGSSGSGKSTFLNALIRFYDADRGCLREGKQDVRNIDLSDYRGQFAYVFQDIRLFSESLRYNLCYGTHREVTDEEIMEKCRQAGLSDFVAKQEKGLDSIISEGGSNISGGERQRIGIVRALLRDSDFILLDEATANLDAETEREVLSEISERYADKTMIMVAHRLSLIKDADRIFYMDDGRIIAEGSHDQLMDRCDKYRRLMDAESMAV